MAKDSIVRDNPVIEALRKLKDEESELIFKLKPLQEAIGALEKIVDKTVKKVRPANGSKESPDDNASDAENKQDDIK